MKEVRQALHSEIPDLIGMAYYFAEKFGRKWSIMPVEHHAKKVLSDMIDHHVLLVSPCGDGLAGAIGGRFHPHLFNPDVSCLTQLFWWVRPEFKNTSVGARLLDAYETVGEGHKNGVRQMIMGQRIDSPIRDLTWERRGYTLTETAWLKEL